MATPSGECKACGCGLNHADVRQLALYYRQEQPSLVAVQYVCPRCGHSEWRHQRPADLEREASAMLGDWQHIARELGLAAREPAAAIAALPSAAPASELQAITLDEYIDFGQRLTHLSAQDLRQLDEPA